VERLIALERRDNKKVSKNHEVWPRCHFVG